MSRRLCLARFALFVALTSCGRACQRPEESAGVVRPDRIDAAPVALRLDGGNAPPLLDLLQYTDAQVAVSSRVDNPHDYPEHLVDGNPETAWNGRTGDLVGGFIAFAVPDDADVMTVAISAGFDKRAKDGEDLFTANHRIKKIRITRNGTLVRDAVLDIEKRKPQELAIGTKGGAFRLEVVEVEPGTRKQWRELVVSELAVLGRPGQKRRSSPRVPAVRVGALVSALDATSADAGMVDDRGTIPFPSVEAFCAHHTKRLDATYAARPSYGIDAKPYCTVDTTTYAKLAEGPFLTVRSATIWDERDYQRAKVLLVETPAGLYESPLRVQLEPRTFASCGPTIVHHAWVDGVERFAARSRSWILLGVVQADGTSSYGDETVTHPSSMSYERRVTACLLDGGRLACAAPALVASAPGDFADLAFDRPEQIQDIAWVGAKRPAVRGETLVFE